jgi:hypothetical protein
MKWWRKTKARWGLQLCRFGLWLSRETSCLAHEPKHFVELEEEVKQFRRLQRQFRIQAGDLEMVKHGES